MRKLNSALAVLLLISSIAPAQESQDSIIKSDVFGKLIGHTCLGRESLVQAVLNKDLLLVKKLNGISVIANHSFNQGVYKLTTKREEILIQFLVGEYEEIVNDVRYFRNYFNINSKDCRNLFYYSYECGNLTTGLLQFWMDNTGYITNNILNSKLNNEEKDLLILYYKNILLYIEAEDNIPEEFYENAKKFKQDYLNGNYLHFTNDLIKLRKKYVISALTLNLNFGSGVVFGEMKKYVKNSFLFSAELGYIYSDFQFKMGYKSNFFNYRDKLRLNDQEFLTLSQSKEIYHHGFVTNLGFYFYNRNRIKVKSFLNLERNRFVNRVPDENAEEGKKDYFSEKGKTHSNLNLGLEGGLQLFPVKSRITEYLYYPREEKDRNYNKVFINTGIAYQPNVFKNINSEGGFWYWYIGIESFTGMTRARYFKR